MTTYYKVFTRACYALTVLVIALLFVENFIFSSQLGYLGFREVDDVAFQYSIRQVHLNMLQGHIGKLLTLNDYAYGWVFWMTMSLVTFPFFLLSYIGHIDWPLIVAPRQISLLFAVLCLLTLRKMLKRFAMPEWVCAGAVLMLTLLPFTGYFSMRFGTVNAIMFFAMLSLYLAMRDRALDLKELSKIAISLAIAGAIKLTGLMITPLVGYFVYKRLKAQYGDQPLPTWVFKAAAIFCVTGVLLAAPQLPYVIFKPSLLRTYLENLQHFIEVTRIPSGSSSTWQRFYEGALGTPGVAVVYGILTCGLLIGCSANGAAKKNPHRFEFRAIVIALGMVGAYLSFTVKNSLSLGSYFTCISFLFFLGLAPLLKNPRAVWLLVVMIVVLMADAAQRATAELEQRSTAWNHMSYYIKKVQSTQKLELSQKTMACITAHQPLASLKHIFLDYTAPSLINSLSLPNACVSLAWNNLSYQSKYCDTPVDFLVLDSQAIGYLPDDEFQRRMNNTNHSIAEGYQRDKASRALLESSGQFGNQTFRLVCDLGETRVFKAQ